MLSHVLRDGTEHPIAYVSRTLSSSEKNYAQIKKEALALVFGVRKFHLYIYRRRFTLVTDHKPLLSILGPKTGIPPLAAAGMQRWSFLLSAYQYDIIFKPTALHCNAAWSFKVTTRASSPARYSIRCFPIQCWSNPQLTCVSNSGSKSNQK